LCCPKVSTICPSKHISSRRESGLPPCLLSKVVPYLSILSEASAIEYAVLVLKVANIVVCGHSECGAMKAAMAYESRPDAPNLEKWLHHARTAAFRLKHEGALDSTLQPHDQLSQLNVLVQIEHLMSYPIVREQVAAGALQLSGWWFDIAAAICISMSAQAARLRSSTANQPND
jgi:carbonic anhydrase